MTTKPKTRKAAAPARKPAAIDDPIFGLIAEHKALTRKYFRLQYKLDDAESKAAETHGKRPFEMTLWRGCDAFSEEGIDARREEFLSQPGVDREQIEKEYAKPASCGDRGPSEFARFVARVHELAQQIIRACRSELWC